MTIKNCKIIDMKVEIIKGQCELAETCFNDRIKNCNKCKSKKQIKEGNLIIKEHCKQALVRGYF